MFCHAVYTASHAINRSYTPFLREFGLTYPQYIVLTLLWERDNQKIGELAEQVEMESNTMTPLVKRLEDMGHIARKRGETDKRETVVSLTNKGRALKKKAPTVTACMIEKTTLSPVELNQLQLLLTKLRHGLIGKDTQHT